MTPIECFEVPASETVAGRVSITPLHTLEGRGKRWTLLDGAYADLSEGGTSIQRREGYPVVDLSTSFDGALDWMGGSKGARRRRVLEPSPLCARSTVVCVTGVVRVESGWGRWYIRGGWRTSWASDQLCSRILERDHLD